MSAKLSAGLLVALGLSFTTSIASAKRVVYAIAIGNNQPSAADTALRPLRYADDDAARFFELFSRFARRTELLSVLDEATQRRHSGLASRTALPSLAQLREVLAQYRRELNQLAYRGEKPALYISFSGHGSLLPSGDYGLSFLDGELTKRMLFEEILPQFGDVQVHLIIDACHAAGVVGLKGAFENESDANTTEIADAARDDFLGKRSLDRFPNVGVIVAASATETSHEWSRIESGVFSHEILSGLYGAADVNGDHRIEYSELLAFVSAANRGLPPGAAKPRIISAAPAANLRTPLVDLMELRGSILLAGVPRDLGHFYIETSKGQRLLDAHIERSQSVLIALPSTEGELYLRDAHREAKLPILPRVELAQLTFSSQGEQARGSVDGALQEGLFSSAFGADYYRGYVDSQSLVPVEFGPPSALPSAKSEQPLPNAVRNLDRSHSSAWPAYAMVAISGAAVLTSITLGLVAIDKRRDFNRTNLQRESHELANDYEAYGNASLATAAVGVGAGVGAFLLWPSAQVLPGSPGSRKSLGFALRGAF